MKRVKSDTATWHVFARGARRLFLFYEDHDFNRFLKLLGEAAEATGCVLFAYAVMSNHYHLLLEATSEQLTRCMHRLNYLYSKYHNEKYGMTGHAFDGPYRAFRQATWIVAVYRLIYIILNPVRAGLCTRPEEYRWSSFKSYLGMPGSPLGVVTKPVLSALDPDPEIARAKLKRRLRREMERKVERVRTTPTASQIHQEQFSALLGHARDQGPAVDGVAVETVALYWGRQCGVPAGAMARVLGNGMNAKSVSNRLYKLKLRLERDPALAERIRLP